MSRSSKPLAILLLAGALVLPAATEAQPLGSLATGRLLVAREGLRDPNFARTVVLLVSYGELGAAGVVLNRPSHMQLDHLLPHLEITPEDYDPVFLGGPVALRQATILSTANQPHANQTRIIGSVHMTGDLALLERMVTDPLPAETFRVYAGHSGWGPGQLEAEIERRGWHIFPASEEIVFSENGDDLWEMFIRQTRSRLAQR